MQDVGCVWSRAKNLNWDAGEEVLARVEVGLQLGQEGVRRDVWLRNEGEDYHCGIEDYYARVAGVEARCVLAADNLVHAWVLPSAGRGDGGRGIVCARGRGCAFLRCEEGD